MCDSMADFTLLAHCDYDTFDDEANDGYRRYHSTNNFTHSRPYDPTHYSRLAAVCQKCGARYDNLQYSVAETAEKARIDGWQIEHHENGYEWYCPKCRAIHDFENVETSNSNAEEVKPIKRAVWVFESCKPDNAWAWWYKCSECGFNDDGYNQKLYPFCPNCGVKMSNPDGTSI